MLIVNYLLYVKEFKVAGYSLQDFPRLNSLSVNATIMVSKKTVQSLLNTLLSDYH